MNNAPSKIEVINQASIILNQKIERLSLALNNLQDAVENETKSSAGDKFETSMEMLKQEQQKIEHQVGLTKLMIQQLHTIKPLVQSEVAIGALVFVNNMWLFLSVALGKIEVQNQVVHCISMQSPLAMALKGKRVSDTLVFQQNTMKIEVCL